MPLQTTELGAINGGTSPVVVTVVGEEGAAASFAASVRFCSAVSGFTLNQAQHSFGGVQKAVDTAKKVGGWIENHL